jgi:hypothetical protein
LTKAGPAVPSGTELARGCIKEKTADDVFVALELAPVVLAVIALLLVGVLTVVLFWAGGTHPV